MEELVKQIIGSYDAMITDAKAQIEKGNKAAGTRARKASLELEKLLKDFRKKSIEAAKQ
jgi:septum formation inhibitor-activating ATPase MinD